MEESEVPLERSPLEPSWFPTAREFFQWSATAQDVWLACTASAHEIEERAVRRLDMLIGHARQHSPFYRERCHRLPHRPALDELPPVSRGELMAQFDRWVCDPEVRLDDVRAFIADPARIGHDFLGRYAVWTSSGTSGVPGIYLHDGESLNVYEALSTLRASGALGNVPMWMSLMTGGRLALVVAVEGHFAAIASWQRLRRRYPWVAHQAQALSVLQPLPEIVERLNAFMPSFLSSYPTMLTLLAQERRLGRLRIAPTALWSGGEYLSAADAAAIRSAFDCPLIEEYGASECMSIAVACPHSRLHVNADWVVLEPVDEAMRPVPAGTPSATVLLTDLANRVQPIIRYDLGDSVTIDPERCTCGSALPVVSVQGRRDDVLALVDAHGAARHVLPLAIATVVEEAAGAHRFQIRQAGPSSLSIRFEALPGEHRTTTWHRIREGLSAWLHRQGLGNVALHADAAAPEASGTSGKLRQVIGGR